MSELNWDGKERRQRMSQDQIERDRLLTEVHSDIKHIVTWSKKHDVDDDTRFEKLDGRLKWAERMCYGAIGVYIFIQVFHLIK